MNKNYEFRGRRVLMEYTCGRCGKTHVEPYENQAEATEGNLQSFRPPDDWMDDSLTLPLLCGDCHNALKEFMQKKR